MSIEELCHKKDGCGGNGQHHLDCPVFDVPVPVRKEIIDLRAKLAAMTRDRNEWKKKHDEVAQRYGDSLWEKKP